MRNHRVQRTGPGAVAQTNGLPAWLHGKLSHPFDEIILFNENEPFSEQELII
jgi:hypothetical protein